MIQLATMERRVTSGARDQHRHRRVPRALRWLLRPFPRRRKQWDGVMQPNEWAGRPNRSQRRIDQVFWGLINDHNWLQYPDYRERK